MKQWSQLRPARPEDAARLEAIRRAAFAPVFASFKAGFEVEIPSVWMCRKP